MKSRFPQPSLFDTPEEQPSVPTPKRTYTQCLTEQIIRDERVLAGDPFYHEPSREFYEQRSEAYREELVRLAEPA